MSLLLRVVIWWFGIAMMIVPLMLAVGRILVMVVEAVLVSFVSRSLSECWKSVSLRAQRSNPVVLAARMTWIASSLSLLAMTTSDISRVVMTSR
ncbi:MAG: hypothetical protein P9C36_13370 [Defluviicoccus sp.]|nr:hypothetical protein [Defluviicoccus sp.]MDG4593606.1 hypothetical protein [Defluviicoccus sp.]